MLDRCNDPPCPNCGCEQSRLIRAGTWWGLKRMERRRCSHCGKLFSITVNKPPPPEAPPEGSAADDSMSIDGQRVAEYHVTKCPYCGSKRVPVQHTDRPVRFHKCADCGRTFKSVER